ncbi:DNA polymerase I [Caulifigura coniformis]|uniref:DNA polymerase I n=1 Tax=Caulifigura coniformis TaxID=2527983 RepID=A0A517SBC7_9PLAN|nr:DNA polymerase I [Caulifigura coniformis]QDT53414.1 DNA polymerase I [Caulifigura coniformis]
MSETLYIVDTFSLVFQVYHAIRQPMTGSRGQPTNAVFGFTGDLEHLLSEKRPTHLILAMESQGPQTRTEMFPSYKEHRSEMPEDLRPQIPMIFDVVAGYRIPVLLSEGWEADDVLATVACRAAERGMDVRIVTADKDARQLIGPKVKIYSIRKKQFYDETELLADWGVRPDQVIDFQALVGDSVDNIPGVPQVGPKTATQLIQQFGTLDAILANPAAAKVRSKAVIQNLTDYADRARMSRELARLNCDLPLEIDWEAARVKEPDWERLYELFTDYGFRRYASEAQMRMKEGRKILKPEEHVRQWFTIRDWQQFEQFYAAMSIQPAICFDLETTSTDPMQADIVGWAFSWEKDVGYYIPVAGPPGDQLLDAAEVLKRLSEVLGGSTHPAKLLNQNIKYDLLVLRRAGVNVDCERIGLDPMIGDYLLDAGARSHGLDELSKKYLQREVIPISDLIGSGKKQLKMFEVEVDRAAEYATEDADVALQIAGVIEEKLHKEGLWDLYWTLERPLIAVLADMEFQGIRVDVEELKRQSDSAAKRLEELMGQIHQIAGREFNIASPKQLAEVLFTDLKLPVIKRTKTGPSTDEEVLTELASKHELPARIIEHRMLSKLKGTYLDALPAMVNPFTGRVHTSFSQVTAATGRLSSSDPNLQNIPIRTEEGRRVRKAFVPSEPGWKLVSADYSQIELRILAHYCEDPVLIEAFRRGDDIHRLVAAQVFEVPLEDVTSDQRRIAKAVNFGVIYGQTSFGLSAVLGIPKEDAQTFIDGYFQKYSRVKAFIEATLDEALEKGYSTTILGRRREVSGIRPKRWGNMNLPERTAVNAVIQGSAADLIKKAMIHVHGRLKRENHPARLLLQIHDELLFECPEAQVDSLIALAKGEMESAIAFRVPIAVDVSVGDNWLKE